MTRRRNSERTLPVDSFLRGQQMDRWEHERKQFVREAKTKPGKLLRGVLEAQQASIAVDAHEAYRERGKGVLNDHLHPYARRRK